jgi:hypothetical protein
MRRTPEYNARAVFCGFNGLKGLRHDGELSGHNDRWHRLRNGKIRLGAGSIITDIGMQHKLMVHIKMAKKKKNHP